MQAPPKKKKIRPLGDILLDMEPLMNEAMDHELQWGDFLGLMHAWLMIHRPHDREEYTAGGHPEFRYGPKETDDETF
jgi:hypothetical protein